MHWLGQMHIHHWVILRDHALIARCLLGGMLAALHRDIKLASEVPWNMYVTACSLQHVSVFCMLVWL